MNGPSPPAWPKSFNYNFDFSSKLDLSPVWFAWLSAAIDQVDEDKLELKLFLPLWWCWWSSSSLLLLLLPVDLPDATQEQPGQAELPT